MDAVILALLIVVTVLMVVILARRGQSQSKVEAALNKSFLEFQQQIQQTMSATRQEVERSKDVMSDNAIRTLATLKDMGQTVESLVQQQQEAEKLGQSLKSLLQKPKLQGNYGETILEELLERVLPQGIWERQYTIDNRERVDVAIKVKDIVVPIDAKFPRSHYDRFLNAETSDKRKEHWKAYITALKVQIRSISSKYVKPEKGTTEVALMFIPSEAMYYDTFAAKDFAGEAEAISDFAQTHSVVPVSPNTLFVFLQMVILGIRNIDIVKNARHLQVGLAALERNFDLFFKKFEEVGKGIEKASEAYQVGERHIKRFKNNLGETIGLEIPEAQLPEMDESPPTSV